ncbi:MAG: MFS transporter [Pseudomonadota bacterium]
MAKSKLGDVNETTFENREVATIDEVITTVVMSRVTDFFGFFVYAIASALVFPRLFFPNFDRPTGTLLSFAVFALAFLARPFASLIARHVQRKIGKTGKITLATMILGTSTVAIGLLPGYEEIGWLAPALLAALRIAQGLGLGGSWDGITLQLQNAAPKGREGLYAMVPQLGGPIGFCVAASLFYVLTGFLTDEEFINYGWRFAFFAVMAVNLVSLFARLRLLNTDFGADEVLTQSSPFLKMLRSQWRPIALSTFTPLASYALFHMVTVFPLGYAILYSDRPISETLMLQLIGGAFAVATVILSGVLADRLGRRWVLTVSTTMIIALCLTIGTLESHPWVYIIFGFLLLGFAQGQAGVTDAGRYKKKYAYSASALDHNLAWIFGAAFAPLVGLALTINFGLWAASIYLLSGVLVTRATIYLAQVRERALAEHQQATDGANDERG